MGDIVVESHLQADKDDDDSRVDALQHAFDWNGPVVQLT